MSTLDEWSCTVVPMVDYGIRYEGQKVKKRRILRTSACVKDSEALHYRQ